MTPRLDMEIGKPSGTLGGQHVLSGHLYAALDNFAQRHYGAFLGHDQLGANSFYRKHDKNGLAAYRSDMGAQRFRKG